MPILVLLGTWAPATAAQGHAPEPDYQDDRSTPEAVIGSYYDAINRQEYARAYSYREPGAAETQLPPFDEFQQGYADTTSVQLTTGDVGSGVGAGQLYFSVPVTLVATTSDGSTQTFVGCYTLHLARPSFQVLPPYRPMAIQQAVIQQVDNNADTLAAMGQSCPAV
jgi:hypothetical protein